MGLMLLNEHQRLTLSEEKVQNQLAVVIYLFDSAVFIFFSTGTIYPANSCFSHVIFFGKITMVDFLRLLKELYQLGYGDRIT